VFEVYGTFLKSSGNNTPSKNFIGIFIGKPPSVIVISADLFDCVDETSITVHLTTFLSVGWLR